MMRGVDSSIKTGVILCLVLCLAACETSSQHQAPVVNFSKQGHSRQGHQNNQNNEKNQSKNMFNSKSTYVVRNGETLFSIAKRSGQDPQSIAVANGIQAPYKIAPGQKLVLRGNVSRNFNNSDRPVIRLARQNTTAAKVNTRVNTSNHSFFARGNNTNSSGNSNNKNALNTRNPKRINTAHTNVNGKLVQLKSQQQQNQNTAKGRELNPNKATLKTAKVASGKSPTIENIPNNIHWRWPVQGRILRPFQGTGKGKGIDIAGTLGKPVKAAAEGTVVYSGNGLKGYGNLIIIKHSEDFLSAYAHNRELRVKEGEQVRLGQEIALMGQSDAEQVKVHFEIRYKGKPVNPLRFLPKV
jgi:lipoprotein NlpD